MMDAQPQSMLRSGLEEVDRYLQEGFLSVRGMSSRFAAAIAAATLGIQSDKGIKGHFAEIGTFEGRFFIALAHALQAGEKAIGIDHFEWPDAGVVDRFRANLARFGPRGEQAIVLKADSRKLAPEDLFSSAPGERVRFFHIDGEHTAEHLERDLLLAHGSLHPKGVICLDDMLHPGYPMLAITVEAYLRSHPDMRVFCVIDREDIVAAAKFMLCRADAMDFYVDALGRRFPQHVWSMGADFGTYQALVLTPEPKLAKID